MFTSSTPKTRRLRNTFVAGIVAAVALTGVTLAPANAATAQTVTAQTVRVTTDRSYDGEWAPSHKESTRVIPLCKGPTAVAKWLSVNFIDHGRDIDRYIAKNYNILKRLATGKEGPATTLAMLGSSILQIPTYALNDALFHLPATALSVATGCGVLDRLDLNPFRALR